MPANKHFDDADILKDIFELPMEWVMGLYSIEYCLTKHSISKETNDEKRLAKEEWLQLWKISTTNHFRAKTNDNEFTLICDDIALQEYLRKLNKKTKQKSYSYLVIIESMFFRPYYDLGLEINKDADSPSFNFRYKLDTDYLSIFTRAMGIDNKLLDRFTPRFKKAYMAISGKGTVVAISAILSGLLIAVSAGALAPEIAVLFSAAGLSGAAAISSGLAALGGGAIAIGGYGMAGGITVLVASGGILGIAGGAGVGALVASSPNVAIFLASKLEVYFREVLLPLLNDPGAAKKILKGQSSFIDTLSDMLNEKSAIPDTDKKVIKTLMKAIKFLQAGLQRNRNTLIKYLETDK